MRSDSSPRRYRKGKRAVSEEATRRRITEAAVELHGTVGPAKTTMSEVARRAGVSRMTVYNHFPTEADLFLACSSHWASANPFPDPSAWSVIEGPAARLHTALKELYGWYAARSAMLGNVLRDTQVVPSLSDVMDRFWLPYMDTLVSALAEGWDADPESLRPMLLLAVDFETADKLVSTGLDPDGAADLAARMVIGAVGSGGQRNDRT